VPLKEGIDTSYVIKPDYGSLEERLAKRQNLPLELDGDGMVFDLMCLQFMYICMYMYTRIYIYTCIYIYIWVYVDI